MSIYYAQFREGDAILYSESEWFDTDLQPNYRKAIIEVEKPEVVQGAFDALKAACKAANPTIDWSDVPEIVREF